MVVAADMKGGMRPRYGAANRQGPPALGRRVIVLTLAGDEETMGDAAPNG